VERRERFARIILNGFESYFAEFQNITLGARSRFENADWPGFTRDERAHRPVQEQARVGAGKRWNSLPGGAAQL
jgi:isocitrate dehydrogenase kinase/phosphatase